MNSSKDLIVTLDKASPKLLYKIATMLAVSIVLIRLMDNTPSQQGNSQPLNQLLNQSDENNNVWPAEEIAAYAIFGAKPTPAPQLSQIVQPTRLDINIVGIISDSNDKLSSALIQVNHQPAQRFFNDQTLIDDYVITKVDLTGITIKKGSQTLTYPAPFQKNENKKAVNSRANRILELQAQTASPSPTGDRDSQSLLQRLKQRIDTTQNADNQ